MQPWFYDNPPEPYANDPEFIVVERLYCLDYRRLKEADWEQFGQILRSLPGAYRTSHDGAPCWFDTDKQNPPYLCRVAESPLGLHIKGVLSEEDWLVWDNAFREQAKHLPKYEVKIPDEAFGEPPHNLHHILQFMRLQDALWDAIDNDDLEEVGKLIRFHPHLVSATSKSGRTPLHWLATYGGDEQIQLQIATLLLSKGVNVNAKSTDEWAWTPLHEAVFGFASALVPLLLFHGSEVNAQDKDGNTPLHFAAQEGYINIVKILLEYGADPYLTNNNKETPLRLAWEDVHRHSNDHREVIELLSKQTNEHMGGCGSVFFIVFIVVYSALWLKTHLL